MFMTNNINVQELVKEAIVARERAYTPYSNFDVGAALLTVDGKIYHGCNIENAAYSPTNCAERTAFFSAVYAGERKFSAIAVAGWYSEESKNKENEMAFPCGVCRQVMMEFCNPETFQIIVTDSKGNLSINTLSQLLPHGFGPDNLY